MKQNFLLLLAKSQITIPAHDILVTNANDSGAGSLRQAIADASDNQTIAFHPSLIGTPIILSTEISIAKPLSIVGYNFAAIEINGNFSTRIFKVANTVTLNLSNLTFKNGYISEPSGAGAAIKFNIGGTNTITVSNCVFIANEAVSTSSSCSGGAVSVARNYNITFENCLFIQNSGRTTSQSNPNQCYGSAIGLVQVSSGNITCNINKCLFDNNVSNSSGLTCHGVIGKSGTVTLNVTNSTFYDNTNSRAGSGSNPGCLIAPDNVLNCSFVGNTSTGDNGAVNDAVTVINCIFKDNVSGGSAPDIKGTVTNLQSTIVSTSGFTITNDLGGNQLNTDAEIGDYTNENNTYYFPIIEDGNCHNTGTDLSGSGITDDQLGNPRPMGDEFDIGSIEFVE